jgi:hypothetical protein
VNQRRPCTCLRLRARALPEVLIGGRVNAISATVALDPFVGARLQAPKTGKDRLSQLFELDLTYRVISMDYTGGGSPAVRYDVRTYGPEVGFSFHF